MSRRRKEEDKTLISYRNVLDSMVNFLGATGALLRQRIETGQRFPCEVECVACSPQTGYICPECSKPLATYSEIKFGSKECPVSKECASLKAASKTTTDKASAPEIKEDNEQPAEVIEEVKAEVKSAGPSSSSVKGSRVCVCAQVKTIKETASRAGVDVGKSQGNRYVHIGKEQNQSRNICLCPPGDKKKTELENIIVDRLQTVSKLIDLIQVDLSHLSGKSNSAALYQEIMKERSALSPPIIDISRISEYPAAARPCRGREFVRRRLFNTPDPSPITAEDYQEGTPLSPFQGPLALQRPMLPIPSSQSPSVEDYPNFVQCIFQNKVQRPGQAVLGNPQLSALPSQNDRRIREPTGGLVYHSLPMGGSSDLESSSTPGSGNPCRGAANSQQHSQPLAPMASANRQQHNRIGSNNVGAPRNLGSLQRATNFAGGTRAIAGYSGLHNYYSSAPATCRGLNPPQNTRQPRRPLTGPSTNYAISEVSGLSYLDQGFLASDDDCDNENCNA